MDAARFLDHPLLQDCRRKIPAGKTLFKQGESGQSLFILFSGTVRLVKTAEGKAPYTAALVGAGDILGEKIILNDNAHPRFFTALADTDVVAVEIGPTEITRMEQEAPYLVKTLFKASLELAEKRLERANQLIGVLRSSDNATRFVSCLQFLAKTVGRNTVDGVLVSSLASSIHMHIDLTVDEIESRLAVLKAKGKVVAKGEDTYLIPDPAAIP